jgi:hypothetical protein
MVWAGSTTIMDSPQASQIDIKGNSACPSPDLAGAATSSVPASSFALSRLLRHYFFMSSVHEAKQPANKPQATGVSTQHQPKLHREPIPGARIRLRRRLIGHPGRHSLIANYDTAPRPAELGRVDGLGRCGDDLILGFGDTALNASFLTDRVPCYLNASFSLRSQRGVYGRDARVGS